jgi:hypothetical protein
VVLMKDPVKQPIDDFVPSVQERVRAYQPLLGEGLLNKGKRGRSCHYLGVRLISAQILTGNFDDPARQLSL